MLGRYEVLVGRYEVGRYEVLGRYEAGRYEKF